MSIPFWQPPPTPDYSAQMGNTMNLVGAVKDYQAKNALQNIYQNAIDPTTGAFDQQKFNLGVRNSPAALWNAGKAMEQSGQAQEAMGRGTIAQTEAYRSQLQNMAGVYADIANSPNRVPPAELQRRLEQEYQRGGVNSQYYTAASNVIKNMDPNEDGRELARDQLLINADADTRLKAALPGYTNLDTGSQILQIQGNPMRPGFGLPTGIGFPKTMTPDTAGQVIDIKMSDGTTQQVQVGNAGNFLQAHPGSQIASGPHPAGGAVTNSDFGPRGGRYNAPTPTTASDQTGTPAAVAGGGTVVVPSPKPPVPPPNATIGTGPTGQPITATAGPAVTPTPTGDTVISQPLPPPDQRGATGSWGPATAPPTAGQPATTIGGRQVTQTSGAPGGSAALYAQPPRQGPPPSYGRSPSAGEVSSIGAVTARGTAAYNQMQDAVTGAKDQVALIDGMITDLNVKGWSPGFGATAFGTLRQIFQNFGLTAPEPGKGFNVADPQRAQEEFVKQSGQLAAAQLKQLGNATDARQELSEATNPGLLLSKYGNLGILYMLKGTQLASQAEGQAWQRAQDNGWLPGANVQNNFNTWKNERFLATDPQTGGRFDPRVFWLGSMPTLREQQDYLSHIDPDLRAQFRANLNYAASQGWIQRRPDGSAVATVQ